MTTTDLIDVQTLQSTPMAQRRIVLMPAALQPLEHFRHNGFDTALHERAPATELLLAAPRLAHLNDRRWLPVLHDELIVPARARGVPVWLGGVSLGAFMALRLAAQYPGDIDGLCLLAPYLGSRIIAAEVADGADRDALHEDDDERRIWRYVARLGRSMPTQVFLGFGSEDRFADTQQLLARLLPATGATTCIVPGGHDWPVWRQLWQLFVQQLPCVAGS